MFLLLVVLKIRVEETLSSLTHRAKTLTAKSQEASGWKSVSPPTQGFELKTNTIWRSSRRGREMDQRVLQFSALALFKRSKKLPGNKIIVSEVKSSVKDS